MIAIEQAPVRERPILFSGPMVRAILEGRKTQTRRVVNLKPQKHDGSNGYMFTDESGNLWRMHCPYGHPGDMLWVRETWCSYMPGSARYRADGHNDSGWTWRPSIFMPRWASRLSLRVTGVRVERVQDISDEDVWAEGLERVDRPLPKLARALPIRGEPMLTVPRQAFAQLWNQINAKRGYGWDANPWVWVVSFGRCPMTHLLTGAEA